MSAQRAPARLPTRQCGHEGSIPWRLNRPPDSDDRTVFSTLLTLFTTVSTIAGPTGTSGPAICAAAGPAYYAFELITTKNIPGTGLAKATAEVSVSSASPFSVALAADGSYEYDLKVSLTRMKTPQRGHLVAWVTTREIDRVERMGTLDANLQASGAVSWNKFIVVVTLESSDDPPQTMWNGPIVFRGGSRSGMMHTMVGHGPLQQENCAAYGYAN